MNFRYQCLSCDYFTSTKCNIVRHNKSTLHLRLCIEEEIEDYVCMYSLKSKKKKTSLHVNVEKDVKQDNSFHIIKKIVNP